MKLPKFISALVAKATSPASTAADLEQALADARREQADATAARDAAEEAYRDALLSALDGGRAAYEAVTEAKVRVDRAELLVAKLVLAHSQAVEREARDALTAERAAVEAEAEAVAELLRGRYPEIARELVGLLGRLDAAEDAVSAVNAKLVEADRSDEALDEVEWRAIPAPETGLRSAYSLLNQTHLRDLGEFAPGYAEIPVPIAWGVGNARRDLRPIGEWPRASVHSDAVISKFASFT